MEVLALAERPKPQSSERNRETHAVKASSTLFLSNPNSQASFPPIINTSFLSRATWAICFLNQGSVSFFFLFFPPTHSQPNRIHLRSWGPNLRCLLALGATGMCDLKLEAHKEIDGSYLSLTTPFTHGLLFRHIKRKCACQNVFSDFRFNPVKR